MTIELLQTISLVVYIVAGVLFLVSIALFILLDVPKLFGDLTGATAKKAIESIRQQNESTGNKAYKPSPVNRTRGKITDKITQSGKIVPKDNGFGAVSSIERFNTAELSPTSSETTVLEPTANETTVLGTLDDGTTVVCGGMPVSGETTVLSEDQIMNSEIQASFGEGLSVDVEMYYLASDEIIE